MNERIRALAIQAAGRGFDTFATSDLDSPEKIELFAELIVRECAEIAKHNVMNISTYSDAEFVEEQIREHFGVDE